MATFAKEVESFLSNLKGTGNFCSIGNLDFVFPGLFVKGIGEVSFPITEGQAKTLIGVAHRSSFGKGSETIQDLKVRKGWEIEPDAMSFKSDAWQKLLQSVIKEVKKDLGISDNEVSLHLYKMLIYEKGDFFLKHKDTEKQKGMFGTIIIGLPSNFAGGELEISFDGKKVVSDFSKKPYQLNYTAFYADCDHEVKLLLSGYRICLVYNLVQEKGRSLKAFETRHHIEEFGKLLSKSSSNKPHIILLGHQYTPANFSISNLKLDDRLKADVMVTAATELGYYTKLCLVTSFQSGPPMDYDEDSEEIEEIYDESLDIEHWLPEGNPFIYNLEFEAEELITNFPINDGDPNEVENTGYMGNWGPDINHWYHYGAVVIWSKKFNANNFKDLGSANRMEWVRFLNKEESVSKGELKAMTAVLIGDLTEGELKIRTDFNPVGDWIIKYETEDFISKCNVKTLQFYFKNIDSEKWIYILKKCNNKCQKSFFSSIGNEPDKGLVKSWTSFFLACAQKGELSHLLEIHFEKIPDLLRPLFDPKIANEIPVGKSALVNLISLANERAGDIDQARELTNIIAYGISRSFVHDALGPALIKSKVYNPLFMNLYAICSQYLESRVSSKTQAPLNWRRDMPLDTSRDPGVWKVLGEFMADPAMPSIEIRRNEKERRVFEYAIDKAKVDLKYQTIRSGSPYGLLIMKTNASYNRAIKDWEEDVELLDRIKKLKH